VKAALSVAVPGPNLAIRGTMKILHE